MKRALVPSLLFLAITLSAFAQAPEPSARPERRGWFGRMLHPFASDPVPEYKDPQLHGLLLEVRVSPQPIKLSEVRQMEITVTLTNKSKRPVSLDFPTAERIEILLRNSAEKVLTTWSDNHAFAEDPATILINPQEHVQYAETIATRELTPNKVFIAEVFFVKYPELRVRQKFLTAP